jgi:hypothetical protein
VRDEAETSKRRIQPRSDLNPQQLSLISLTSLQPDARASVIILEAEAILMVSRLSNDVGHRLWLQSPLKHLGGELQVSYIAVILRKILEFLHI